MSFTCNQHGWSHLLEACPYCFQYSMSGDATDTSKITFTKEQVIDLAIETWKAREVCWNTEREQLHSKLSAAEKERDSLKSKFAVEVEELREAWGEHQKEQHEEWVLDKNQIASLKDKLAVAVNALTLIASPKRADGSYNRGREACGVLASMALKAINGGED